ncbi:hypothetical protein [Photobacterium damselae]|uniref:hypothetical protein n=1 Tax=Photobacterium damselae TaxID=38293 RepID=UPI001F439AA9|nr:hypothetical protein [Photobacterium damselae]UKA04487.1 hypothetical protein IHC89_22960 [Photobacterium damselae subsp. damselae]
MNLKSKNGFNTSLWLLIAAPITIFFITVMLGRSLLLDQSQIFLVKVAVVFLVGGAIMVNRVNNVPMQLMGFTVIPVVFGGMLSVTLTNSDHILSAVFVVLACVVVAIVISCFHQDLLKGAEDKLNVVLLVLVFSSFCGHALKIDSSIINYAFALVFVCSLQGCITTIREELKTFSNYIRVANNIFINIVGLFISVLCILS